MRQGLHEGEKKARGERRGFHGGEKKARGVRQGLHGGEDLRGRELRRAFRTERVVLRVSARGPGLHPWPLAPQLGGRWPPRSVYRLLSAAGQPAPPPFTPPSTSLSSPPSLGSRSPRSPPRPCWSPGFPPSRLSSPFWGDSPAPFLSPLSLVAAAPFPRLFSPLSPLFSVAAAPLPLFCPFSPRLLRRGRSPPSPVSPFASRQQGNPFIPPLRSLPPRPGSTLPQPPSRCSS